MAGATGVPFLPGNRIDILNNGDEFYPAMLEAIAAAPRSRSPSRPTSTGRARSGCSSREALAAKARDRACGSRFCSTRSARSSIGEDILEDARSRRLPARLVQPDPLVHARPLQPPHPSQVAHHRRPASRSPAAPASRITGGATRRTPTNGATCRSASRARRSRRCRPASRRTGCRRPAS